MSASARIVCIPSRDQAFAASVKRAAGRLPDGIPAADAIAWLAAEVRRSYPTAEIREQDELARREGDEPVWYATKREQHFRIDNAIVVPLEPAAAYAVYVDRVVEWQTAVQVSPRQVTPAIVGNTYEACYQFLGRRYQGTLRVLSAEPPSSVAFEASGSGITVWYETTFSEDAGGTRVEVKGDYELPLQFLERVADRLGLERAIARDIERANEAYRAVCAQDV